MGSADETWQDPEAAPNRKQAPPEVSGSLAPKGGPLPTGMKDEQRRLATTALHLGVGYLVLVPFVEWTAPGRGQGFGVRLAAEVATLAFIAAVLVVARGQKHLRYRTIAASGQALLVVGALGISLVEQWRPLPADVAWPGVPWAAVWLLVFPLVGPGVIGGARAGTVAAALAPPVVAGLAALLGVRDPPTAIGWGGVVVPTFAAAGLHLLPALSLLDLEEDRTGPYRLLRPIGRGGMGEVWLASHKLLARPAAVKLIQAQDGVPSKDRTGREALVRRFHREAAATSRLQSPHTVRLYDYGVAADGRFYYVMELLEGVDLDGLVRRFGPVPAERAVHLVAQACLSLAEAHQQGLVHRDIKPSNLFTCSAGVEVDFLKVLDFGLVAAEHGALHGPVADKSLETQFRGVIGTPAYVAPEILKGRPADARSDIYALGAVLYWLLAGKRAVVGGTVEELLAAQLFQEPTAPGRVAGIDVPPALDDLVLACLAKDPADRPPDMLALRERLLAVEVPAPWAEERALRWWSEHLPPAAPSAA